MKKPSQQTTLKLWKNPKKKKPSKSTMRIMPSKINAKEKLPTQSTMKIMPSKINVKEKMPSQSTMRIMPSKINARHKIAKIETQGTNHSNNNNLLTDIIFKEYQQHQLFNNPDQILKHHLCLQHHQQEQHKGQIKRPPVLDFISMKK